MSRFIQIFSFLLFLSVLLFQSCKTDEFGDVTIKDEWGIDVITPLFTGKGMEFRDFVYNWKKKVPSSPGPFTVLDYIGSPDKKIPTDLIFTPSVVIDSFPFYIQGSYSLGKVELVFTVSNGCPFPLNLKMQWFQKGNANNLGPAILPPLFKEANFTESPVLPVTTIHHYTLDSLQLESFNNSDRVKFTAWYDSTNFINQNDTVSAHYPIDILIVLIGIVRGKDED